MGAEPHETSALEANRARKKSTDLGCLLCSQVAEPYIVWSFGPIIFSLPVQYFVRLRVSAKIPYATFGQLPLDHPQLVLVDTTLELLIFPTELLPMTLQTSIVPALGSASR